MSTSSADRRRALAELVRERDGGRSAGRIIRRTVVALIVVALLALLGAWLTGVFSEPREVLEIRGLVDGQIEELQKVARNELPLAAAATDFGGIMDRVRDLPPDQRRQAGQEVGRLFAARERAEMDSYFNLPPEQRQAELDRRIKAEEERLQAREAARARRESERPAESAAAGGGGRGQGGASTNPGGAAANPGGPRRGRSTTEEERNARSKSRIDRSSPDERARRTEYRRVMDERRVQLGLPPRGGRW